MEDKELAFTPAWRLKEMLDSRELSPVELTDVYLRRIDALDGQLHSYLTVTGDEARATAKEAEDKIARGETGALLGLPVAIKDLEITKGIRSTMGSYVFRDTVPDQDSALVERVRNAGGVILGKTNTPEFGSAGITENKLGPPCRNPWDTDRTPGGSSGGAGSALAAGLCPLASGSDAGGSIRIPASFCGVYGIKGTFGRVPRVGGLGRPSPNLASHPGPMSRTVRDSAMFLQAIAGHDPRDPNSLREAPPDFTAGLNSGVRGLRVAWSTDLGYAAVDTEVASITSASARLFEELGCTIDESDIALDDPIPTFLDIFCTTGYVGNGHLLEEHEADLTNYVLDAMRHAQQVTGADFARALRAVEVLRTKLGDLFDHYDLLMTPTMAVPAFRIGEPPRTIAGRDVRPAWDYTPFTSPFNMTGLPAASVPCGFSSDGMPIGLHIIGAKGQENAVLRASAAFEEARPWAHLTPPVS